jgi:hypothetical protein
MELLHKDLTGKIPGAAMEVHTEPGCGFLEAMFAASNHPRNPRFQNQEHPIP